MSMLERAERVARGTHVNITPGADAAIARCERVVTRVLGDTSAMTVAWLYLLGEESGTYFPETLARLRHKFPPEISEAVDAITHRSEESSEDYYGRIIQSRLALRVKVAALAANGGRATE